ncbi:MAG: 1-deoxy-D-xylulose-5-phosphate synthase [Erysipelotrichaceae bacterium]|nr:1-deoxy-D-xylulose-5-phosphate synthase [Erysipelotrichaceae bacterium]
MNISEIKDPSFLKDLTVKEMNDLAKDIRDFLLESVSKTGGHLSSNLGVVELTIAMHYCFNSPKDKFLFDVGHQSYIHKILTGRAKDFPTLRQFNGMAGFQRRNESEHDCFEAGHSSTSLSTALGMAVARDLNNEDYHILPVVGDGALSSGMSLEALNQIGDLKSKVIIVFNDNNMSISKNVGALTKAFGALRSSKGYLELKHDVKDFLMNAKHGSETIESIKEVKKNIRNKMIDAYIFDDFDIDYLGPVDGHNIHDLIHAFETAKTKDGPVVVHVVTKKGKGYKYTENDSSGKWHGVGKFDVKTGEMLAKTPDNYKSYSKIVSDHLLNIMDSNGDVVAITPAMISGSALNDVFAKYPKRSFDCGIAEDHALTFASGLALNGKKPFVSVYSSFLQRAYDQINHDICRMNLPVVLGIDRASIVGEDGDSHQGVFDIGFMRPLPNMVITEGKDSNEIENLLELGFKMNCPFAIRYPRGSIVYDKHVPMDIKPGTWAKELINEDVKANIITYGNDVIRIGKVINDNMLPYNLYNARFIKPIDEEMLLEIASNKKPIFIYTNDMIKGGIGDDILELLNKNNISVPVYIFGVDDIFVKHGDTALIKESLGLDLKTLFSFIEKTINA